jgi:hypothetical protein
MNTNKQILITNNIRAVGIVLFMLCGLYSNAQAPQSGSLMMQNDKHARIAKENDETAQDTTGKYRIRVPSKKVIDVAAKKEVAVNNDAKNAEVVKIVRVNNGTGKVTPPPSMNNKEAKQTDTQK